MSVSVCMHVYHPARQPCWVFAGSQYPTAFMTTFVDSWLVDATFNYAHVHIQSHDPLTTTGHAPQATDVTQRDQSHNSAS
jgi:hypothetical protein